jgi:hypothetical protein
LQLLILVTVLASQQAGVGSVGLAGAVVLKNLLLGIRQRCQRGPEGVNLVASGGKEEASE